MKDYIVTFAYSINVQANTKREAEEKASEVWDNQAMPYAEEMNINVKEGD